MSHPSARLVRRIVPGKGKAERLPRGSGHQRARQGAMRGFGPQVAAALNLSTRTLEHELEDLARDPVHRVAQRVHALRQAGAAPERLSLYVLEILQTIQPAELTDTAGAATLEMLLTAESCADADENIVGDRALLARLAPLPRSQWSDHLRRQSATGLALADYLDAHPEAVL